MRHNRIELYIHIVWTTKNREPLIQPDIEAPIYRCIGNEVHKLKCRVLALGGMPDHVHLLVSITATTNLDHLMNQVKGVSSHMANDSLVSGKNFSWQRGYGAFSIGRNLIKTVTAYIQNQKQRHHSNELWPEWEQSESNEDKL